MQTHETFSPIPEYVPIVQSCSLEYHLQEVPNVLKSPVLLTTRTPSYVHFVYRTDDAGNTTAGILFLRVSRSSLTSYTSISPHALRAIIGVHRPGPSSGSGWFPGSYDNYRRRPHHLTQNIQIILQSLQVRGGGNKTSGLLEQSCARQSGNLPLDSSAQPEEPGAATKAL